ncbi:hypothetical protein A0J61_05072 [Choanephora cucurbitarum]|uniref:Uncharacterized protein n=1 Tax=Choanephora cucurbitarum TaxID=101091 RepID=A0A1C7NEA8_9FUNG|nr:hypothetical protein A0J61_05072 [Choanephora cucurbitarum]
MDVDFKLDDTFSCFVLINSFAPWKMFIFKRSTDFLKAAFQIDDKQKIVTKTSNVGKYGLTRQCTFEACHTYALFVFEYCNTQE